MTYFLLVMTHITPRKEPMRPNRRYVLSIHRRKRITKNQDHKDHKTEFHLLLPRLSTFPAVGPILTRRKALAGLTIAAPAGQHSRKYAHRTMRFHQGMQQWLHKNGIRIIRNGVEVFHKGIRSFN